MPLALTKHEHWVSAILCLVTIAGVEIIAGPVPQHETRAISDQPVLATWRQSRRKAAKWLWLCVPALIYGLWRLFFGDPFANPWIIYIAGGFAFIGFVGYLVVYSVSYLRATR